MPIGTAVPRPVSVQVISASNRDLLAEANEQRFRADLYYRLAELRFRIPPLRERVEDLPGLVYSLVSRFARSYGRRVTGVTTRALDLLLRYPWPGNVRELENELKRAVLVCPDNGLLQSEHLAISRPEDAVPRNSGSAAAPPPRGTEEAPAAGPPAPLRERLAALERAAIVEALRAAKGNRARAARLLGITRNGLGLKLARLRAAGEEV